MARTLVVHRCTTDNLCKGGRREVRTADLRHERGWENLSEDERKAAFGEYSAISDSPGIYGGAQLQPVETATTIRAQDGQTLTTDGPFPEMKEFLGGYYLLEADTLDSALEVAARIPAVRMGGAVEVRPIVET